MIPHNTILSFDLLNTYNVRTLAVVDTSYYNSQSVISGQLLQVLCPGYQNPVELSYQQSGVTVLNSNNLGITNVLSELDLVPLPDGAYTIKISFCPYEQNWFEKTIYRTTKLELAFDKALLLLDLNSCSTCYSTDLADELQKAWMYIQGVHANAQNMNINQSNECYGVASKIINNIINCRCWGHKDKINGGSQW